MFGLKGRKDAFRLIFPKEFICKEIEEKYTLILKEKHGYYIAPIDFINESIQRVNVLGFNNATIIQNQSYRGEPLIDPNRVKENEFMYPSGEVNYRSPVAPITLTDRTFTVEFKHSVGFLNYFLLYENFWYLFSRDREYKEMMQELYIDIFNEIGEIYARIALKSPFINSMDMLSFDYTQPIASSESFKIEFKYNNFDLQFLNIETE